MKLKLEKKPKKPKKTEKKRNKQYVFLQKRSINLMYREQAAENDPKIMGPLAVLVLLLILLFAKFMVIDKVSMAMQAEAEVQSIRTQAEALRQENQAYEEVKAEYSRYSRAAYNDNELILVAVDHVLTLLDNRILRQADIKSCTYGNNVLNVVMSDVTLQEASDVVSLLYQDPYVIGVSVSTASTREQESTNQKVVANITVQLSNPQTVDDEEVAAE